MLPTPLLGLILFSTTAATTTYWVWTLPEPRRGMENNKRPMVIEVLEVLHTLLPEDKNWRLAIRNPVFVALFCIFIVGIGSQILVFVGLGETERTLAAISAGYLLLLLLLWNLHRHVGQEPLVITIGRSQRNSNSPHIPLDPTTYDENALLNSARDLSYTYGEYPFFTHISADFFDPRARELALTLARGTEIKPGLNEMFHSPCLVSTSAYPYGSSEDSFLESLTLLLRDSSENTPPISVLTFDLSFMFGPEPADEEIERFQDLYREMITTLYDTIRLNWENSSDYIWSYLGWKILVPVFPRDDGFWVSNEKYGFEQIIPSLLKNEAWAPLDTSMIEKVVAFVQSSTGARDPRKVVKSTLLDELGGVAERDIEVFVSKCDHQETRALILLVLPDYECVKHPRLRV